MIPQGHLLSRPLLRKRLLATFVLLPAVLFASKDYQEGKELAEELVMPDPSQVSTKEVPEFKGATPPETTYLENSHLMGDKASALIKGGTELGDVLHEGERTSREFHEVIFDREKKEGEKDNDLIREANEVIADPFKEIKGIVEEEGGTQVEVIETSHTCEEAGEPEEFSCDKTPVFTKKEITVYRKLRVAIAPPYDDYLNMHVMVEGLKQGFGWQSESQVNKVVKDFFLTWFKGRDAETGKAIDAVEVKDVSYVGAPTNTIGGYIGLVRFDVTFGFKDFELLEHWENNCSALEGYVDQNRCAYKSRTCVEGPETRIIHGKPVTKECWRERQTYLCQSPSLNTCGPLRAKGCDQTKVECTRRSGNVCVAYKKTFTCRSEKRGNGITRVKGDVPFCLDGNCDTHGWDSNKDFALAMSKLSIFREMAKDMEGEVTPSAFKGETRGCTRAVLGFQDCCGGDGGWGSSLSLSQNCSPEEKLLKREKNENRCVFVGTHCVQKDPILKTCLKKKSSYCCFGSKIAKLFHEQGRAQLGINWGSSENPNCRALTIEELQAIDFEKIDLSELFEEIQAKTNVENVAHAATSLTETWSGKVKSIKRGDEQKGGGDDGVF